MLPFIMLVEIVLEIGLFMYQLLRSNKPVRSLLSLAVMAGGGPHPGKDYRGGGTPPRREGREGGAASRPAIHPGTHGQ